MTICSLVVQSKPESLAPVAKELAGIAGVQIHARDDIGKLVVSIDHPERSYCSQVMADITRIEGVVGTSLVFEYQEDLE